MSSSPVISVDNVSKRFRHYRNPLRQLAGAFGAKGLGEELTALQPLSFDITRGESIGIIGRNGSGKSTLLSLIAGTSSPTTGTIETHGRVVALLELGSGFDPEFTGRDNVYLNGHILGLTHKQIDERFDEIAAFADIGASIDRPVKTYSSGMQMRLAFSVAAHTRPDILIIDESLSVGDAAFVQKCMRFLRRFTQTGTLLFVSHDLASVKALCDRAIWLDASVLMQDGTASAVGDAYMASQYAEAAGRDTVKPAPAAHRETLQNHTPTAGPVRAEGFEFNPESDQFGDGAAELTDIVMLNAQGRKIAHLEGGEQVTLVVRGKSNSDAPIENPILGFFVRDRLGQGLFGSNTLAREAQRAPLQAGQNIEARFTFTMPRLVSGSYAITAALASGTQSEHTPHDWRHEMMVFEVTASPFNHGLVDILMDEVEIAYGVQYDTAQC
jgi:lipopolysaccharide transport system ATP-binding protein